MSSTGPGPDQPHLLALLRAIRLRLAAPEAAAAGAADTEVALEGRPNGTDAALNRRPDGTDAAEPPGTALEPRSGPFEPRPSTLQPRSARPFGGVEPRPDGVDHPSSPVVPWSGPIGPIEPRPGDVEPGSNGVTSPSGAIEPRPGTIERRPGTIEPRPGAVMPQPNGIGPPGPASVAGVSDIGGTAAAFPTPPTTRTAPATGTTAPADPAGPPPVRSPGHAPGAGAAVPADGMDPADEAALHELRKLLAGSLDLAGGAGAVAARLRAALAQAEPDLLTALPGSPTGQTDQLADALTWLTDHADQPPELAAGCRRLGAALAECGVLPPRLQLVGAALAEAMRAGIGPGALRQDVAEAWRTTWQHAYDWIAHGAASAAYEPTTWAATVIAHERRRSDLAVLRLRPFLPMPYRPGQYARIEVPDLPGVWRPYSLAGAPRRDNVVELHVRAKTESGVSGTLVYRTAVGDRLRIGRAEGAMVLAEPERDLLLIAGDTGVAPFKAVLTEMAATGDPGSAVLFWGVRTLDELYDIEEISEIARAGRRITVVPVISEGAAGPYASGLVTDAVAAYGEWSGHDVYLAGPPVMLAATKAALQQLGVDPARIHHDATE